MLTSSTPRTPSNPLRALFVSLLALGILVALVHLNGNYASEPDALILTPLVDAEFKPDNDGHKCLEVLRGRVTNARVAATLGSESSFPLMDLSKTFKFGYHDKTNGEQINSGANSLPTAMLTSSRLKRFVDAPHKWIPMPNSNDIAILYDDNAVVTSDSSTCQVTGLYLPSPSHSYHSSVSVLKDIDVNANCKKEYFIVCEKDGGRCLDRHSPETWTCINSESKGFVLLFPLHEFLCCPDGSQCPYKRCVDVFNYRCLIATNTCGDLSVISSPVTHSANILGTLSKSSNFIGAAAAFVPNTPAALPFKLLGAFFGLFPAGGNRQNAFDTFTTKVNTQLANVKQCMHVGLAETDARDLETWINSVQSNLSPAVLETYLTVDTRKSHIWLPNEQRCVNIGQRFKLIAGGSHYHNVLPLGVKAMEACLANYVGWRSDGAASGISNPAAKYNVMSTEIYDSVLTSIAAIQNYYKDESRCGYYNTDKKTLSAKIEYLYDVLGRVGQLKSALNGIVSLKKPCLSVPSSNINGNDFRAEIRNDMPSCDALCQSVSQCVAFTYDSAIKRCYLKNSVSRGFDSRGSTVTSAVCPVGGARCTKDDRWNYDDLHDHDVANDIPAQTFEQCKVLCLMNNACHYFTWNKNTKKCYLKSAKGHTIETSKDESGRCS